MSIATFVIGGLIGSIIGIPAIGYIIHPAFKKEESGDLIPLGAASKVEIGTPTLFRTKIQQKAGWINDDRELSFYVFTENGRKFKALSNVCTHLGCRVRWVSDQEQFFCPCHNASFSKSGEVVDGPPPRPLDQYEIKEEGGQLFIIGGKLL
jgi:Rieske Fe-S protein